MITEAYWTAPQLAHELGKSRRTVATHCEKLGVPKIGGRYLITVAWRKHVERSIATARVGRPPSK